MTQRITVFIENDMVDDAMEELDRFYNYPYEKSGYTRITAILENYAEYRPVDETCGAPPLIVSVSQDDESPAEFETGDERRSEMVVFFLADCGTI